MNYFLSWALAATVVGVTLLLAGLPDYQDLAVVSLIIAIILYIDIITEHEYVRRHARKRSERGPRKS